MHRTSAHRIRYSTCLRVNRALRAPAASHCFDCFETAVFGNRNPRAKSHFSVTGAYWDGPPAIPSMGCGASSGGAVAGAPAPAAAAAGGGESQAASPASAAPSTGAATGGVAAGMELPPPVLTREKHIGGSGGSLEPPGSLLAHLHTVYMVYSECLPTRLNPLAERTCFSQARRACTSVSTARRP